MAKVSKFQTKDDEWISVWAEAVAKAWSDRSFRRELFENAQQAIKKEFNFALPAGLQLTVVPSDGSQFANELIQGSTGQYAPAARLPRLEFAKSGEKSKWSDVPNAYLKLILPEPPEINDLAVATVEYVRLGLEDGFTCCC